MWQFLQTLRDSQCIHGHRSLIMSPPTVYLGLLTLAVFILRSFGGNGICSKSTQNLTCCNNYKLSEDGSDCVECDPGFYGDCTTRCDGGWYGQLCGSECSCQAWQRCDHISGCVNKSIDASQTAGDNIGNCSNSKPGCCNNYYKIGNKCVACPDGYYQDNCSETCPELHYGHFCLSKCQCNASLCHHVNGCQTSTTDTPWGPWEPWWIPVVLASVGLLILCVAVGSVCCCYCRKKKTEFNPKHINNATQRQQSRRGDQRRPSERRPCVEEEQPPPCHRQPTCGETTNECIDNYENPYAQITDTARLMPRTRHTPKEVSVPMAPLIQPPNDSYIPDRVSYDILSLKVGIEDEIDTASCSMTNGSGALWAKTLPAPGVNKRLPTPHRSSFLFPTDSSGYIPATPIHSGSRSSEAEIKSLPMPPPPPSNLHQNGFIKKKGKKPPAPPKKPPKGSAVYQENRELLNANSDGIQSGEVMDSDSESKQNTPNNVKRRKKSMKKYLMKDAINRRKTNGKSYNLSGLLDVDEMPPPEFDEDDTSRHGSRDALQNNGIPHSNVFTKCQTALKSKMNRISALKLTGNTLQNLRYSFARPQN